MREFVSRRNLTSKTQSPEDMWRQMWRSGRVVKQQDGQSSGSGFKTRPCPWLLGCFCPNHRPKAPRQSHGGGMIAIDEMSRPVYCPCENSRRQMRTKYDGRESLLGNVHGRWVHTVFYSLLTEISWGEVLLPLPLPLIPLDGQTPIFPPPCLLMVSDTTASQRRVCLLIEKMATDAFFNRANSSETHQKQRKTSSLMANKRIVKQTFTYCTYLHFLFFLRLKYSEHKLKQNKLRDHQSQCLI